MSRLLLGFSTTDLYGRAMRVQIYQDYVHNHGLLLRALNSYFGEGVSVFRDADDIIGGCLADADLFVMPGGADLYYCEKLNGRGNAVIRAFVERGGCYLGICAGAYYGCAAIDWAAGTPQAIAGARELAFFPGTARGPVAVFIEDSDPAKSWKHAAALEWDGDQAVPVFYNGGPVFDETPDEVKVIARYQELSARPAAVVECRVGRGKAVLCGPHLEERGEGARGFYRHRNTSYAREQAVVTKLAPHTAALEVLWHRLLERCAA